VARPGQPTPAGRVATIVFLMEHSPSPTLKQGPTLGSQLGRSGGASRAASSKRSQSVRDLVGSRGGTLTVEVTGHMTGVMQTPTGAVPFEGRIRQVAREEIDADKRFETVKRGG
jgi:hypothetical protein